MKWSPNENAVAFIDDCGTLGLWYQPIPSHYPSPVGDIEAAIAAAVGAAAADDAAATGADAPAEENVAADEPAAGGGRRRLRKVLHSHLPNMASSPLAPS